MNSRSPIQLSSELRRLQAPQKSDGVVLMAVVFLSLFLLGNFLFAPGAASAVIMGLFLCGVGFACARLLNAAAKVVEIRRSLATSLVVSGAAMCGGSQAQPGATQAVFNNGPQSLPLTEWLGGSEHLN